jgi:catechol 2,3-dioxygenase-like lactoylglutathione lyase family enzyme
MATYGFDHIHLRVKDVDGTAAWFAEMLGAEVIRTLQQGKPRVDLKLGGADIFLIAADAAAGPAPVSPYHGIDHFGLSVVGLDAAAAELKAKGVEFSMEPREPRPGIRICFIRGPENISIELLERS